MADRLDLQLLALGLRRTAWIRFWTQTGLGIVILGVLMFNNIGGSLSRNADKALGLGPGLSLTTLSFFVLLFSLWQGWLVVRLGRSLASGARPSRGEASRTIKRSLFADLLGLVFAAVGYQSLAGALFVQASMQTPGIAIGARGAGENMAITSLEMLSVLEQHAGVVCPSHWFAVLALDAAADLSNELSYRLMRSWGKEERPPRQNSSG